MAVMGKTYIGTRAGSVTTSLEFDPITKVILYVSDGVAFTAGTDGGQVLELDCPYATQAMANAILSKLKGRKYRPIQGTDTVADPAAELGDGMTLAGTYTVLASVDETCDSLYTADVGAPGKREPESEIGAYKGSLSRKMTRSAAELRSSITKTAGEITTKVEDIGKTVASVKVNADKIEWLVQGEDSSSFTLTDRMATLVAPNINLDGYVTFSNLSGSYSNTNKTTIDGSLLRTGKIKSTSANNESEWDLTTGVLTTYKMKANEMEASGSFECGGQYSLKIKDGNIYGYVDDTQKTQISMTAATRGSGEGVLLINSDDYIYIGTPKIAVAQYGSPSAQYTLAVTKNVSTDVYSGVSAGASEQKKALFFKKTTLSFNFINGICTSVSANKKTSFSDQDIVIIE